MVGRRNHRWLVCVHARDVNGPGIWTGRLVDDHPRTIDAQLIWTHADIQSNARISPGNPSVDRLAHEDFSFAKVGIVVIDVTHEQVSQVIIGQGYIRA